MKKKAFFTLMMLFATSFPLTSRLVEAKDRIQPPENLDIRRSSDKVVVDVDSYDLKDARGNGASVKASPDHDGFLRIRAEPSEKWPGVSFPHPDKPHGSWNLEDFTDVTVNVRNVETKSLTVSIRVDSPGGAQGHPRITNRITIPPHQTSELSIRLTRNAPEHINLIGMREFPQGLDPEGVDPTNITNFVLFVTRPSVPRTFEIGSIEATGVYKPKPWENMTPKEFFPFIDQFGQFKHADWPGKVKSIEMLRAQKEQEAKGLKSKPGPSNWDQYGGWKDGPKLDATGHFRVKKVDGKWWLIDPQGRLFWSHGIDVVRTRGATVITHRENYFEGLPPKDKPLGAYFEAGIESKIKSGHFKGQSQLTSFDFAKANLYKKYGPDWQDKIKDIMHRRLRSWGINTAGLWSEPQFTSMHRTPYVDWIFYRSPPIEGKTRHWQKMVDMWDPKFERNLSSAAKKLDKLKDDPWLIGVFVDNELPWQGPLAFSNEVLTAPADQPAKIEFISILKERYTDINRLNEAWRSDYESWDSMLHSHEFELPTQAAQDAEAFYKLSAERYYRTVRDIIKDKAPKLLYLGSRLNGDFPIPARAAAKYCDVVSYNRYRDSVGDVTIAGGIDRPIVIGEWHFGASDRGVFGRGLVHADNQTDRARKYKRYLRSALANTQIVGAHWFQYMDESTTGRRLDGENHQIGFVSSADHPYRETIRASRQLGYRLYAIRSR